jgi:exonuclease SbcC
MISSLKLINFQSHKKTELEFAPGINIIVGASDSGKSSILRGLKWLIWNRPLGDNFRSNWGGTTIVKSVINDNTIIRKEGNSKLYKLNDTEFTAFGTTVPEEITKAIDINDLNFQQQLDSPFLISNTSGEVALFFNKIANLSHIDISQQNIKRWLSELKKIISFKENQKSSYEEEIIQYKDIEKLESRIELLEEDEAKLIKLYNNIKSLTNLIADIEEINKKEEIAQEIIKIEPSLLKVDDLKKKVNTLNEDISKLRYYRNKIETLDTKIAYNNKLITYESSINSVYKVIEKKKEIEKEKEKLLALLQNITNNETHLKSAEQQLQNLQTDLYNNMPNICPLCETNLK